MPKQICEHSGVELDSKELKIIDLPMHPRMPYSSDETYILLAWISVKDRLPTKKEFDSVLITNGKDCYVAVDWYPDGDPFQTDWVYSYCCGCKANEITHWMPPLEMPK